MRIHSIFPFLKFFFGLFMLSFAADGGALASLGGGGDAGVIESMADDTGGESAGSGDPDPGADPNADSDPNADPAAKVDTKPTGPELAKPLSGAARTALKALKNENPAAWKEINNRIWSLNGLDGKIAEHFEGGLDQAVQLKGDVDNFLTEAGAESLADVRGELNDYRSTDKKITAGDASFVNDLPQEIQAGIYKMLPSFVQEWQTRDNDGYQRYFAGLVDSTLRDTNFAQNFEMALWKLEEMGTDDPGVKRVHDLLSANLNWMKGLKAKATAAPAAKAATGDNDPVSEREKMVAQREMNIARDAVGGQFRQFADPIMHSALKALYPKGIPANVNKAEVYLKTINNLAVTLGQPFSQKVEQYLKAKDQDGALKYIKTQATKKRLDEALGKAQKYLYGDPASGAAPVAAKDKDVPAGDPPARGQNQFMTVNYNPKASSVDVAATTKLAASMNLSYRQLISQNKAVLKNGKKVTWSRDAENEA